MHVRLSICQIVATLRIRPAVLPALLAGLLLACTAAPARGAAITWSAAQNISGDTDVSTTGTRVGAFHYSPPVSTDVTVNGVVFQGVSVSQFTTSVTSGNFTLAGSGAFGLQPGITGSLAAPFSGLSTDYRGLLNTSVAFFQSLTISGLTVGAQYQFEWWSNDSLRNNSSTTVATAVNSVTLIPDTSGTAGGLGQFAIGTFTADATSQVVAFTPNGALSPNMNAFELRDVTPAVVGAGVPLPAALWPGLITSAGLARFALRRWG